MHATEAIVIPLSAAGHERAAPRPAIEAVGLVRRFGERVALAGVSLMVEPGEIHALLGPNGAGKTTLLRILGGMMRPDAGAVSVLGADATAGTRAQRAAVGLVPSGDRSFYLRLSGLENLIFFARLQGIRRRAARQRALEVMESVGLAEARDVRVGEYSHGMQKRLSVARALLATPPVMLVDEATHDLDPHAARVVRDLIGAIAARGTAVVWATQRLEEIRGFADAVTLLRSGEVCFVGSVEGLASQVQVRRHVVRLRAPAGGEPVPAETVRGALGGTAAAQPIPDDPELFLLELHEGVSLGVAFATLAGAGVDVISCREVSSELEEAFVRLTGTAS